MNDSFAIEAGFIFTIICGCGAIGAIIQWVVSLF